MIKTFDDIVELYDYARPDYPQKLFEDIIAYSEINFASEILDVGAGTGQATTFFANHGYKITALEIGRRQVSYLKEKYKFYPKVRVRRGKFEDIVFNTNFDLLIAASSFHWIDETVRYKKTYTLLNDGGTLAQFWHMHPVQKYNEKIYNRLNDVYSIYFKGRKFYNYTELKEIIEKRMRQLVLYNFKNTFFYEYRYEHFYSASEYTALLSTYSYVRSLGDQKEKFLYHIYKCIKEYGDAIRIPNIVHLYLAKKL